MMVADELAAELAEDEGNVWDEVQWQAAVPMFLVFLRRLQGKLGTSVAKNWRVRIFGLKIKTIPITWRWLIGILVWLLERVPTEDSIPVETEDA
jgi:hypothetical protein